MLLTRKRSIKVANEVTSGTKVAGTLAIRAFDLEIKPAAPFADRKGAGNYRGNEQTGTLGERVGVCTFKAEMKSTGSAALATGLAAALQACGLKQTAEVYQVHSTVGDDKTISIDVWEDGKKKGLSGAMGNVTFEGEVGRSLFLNFEFFGIWQAPTDEAMPAFAPVSTAPMRLAGGTFTIAAAAKKISKFSLNMGNEVVPRMDANAASGVLHYAIADIDPTVSVDPEAELVAAYDYNGIWLAGTEAAVVLAVTDGTDTGTFTLPKVQEKEIPEGDREGIMIYDITGQCNHSSGNDAVKLAIT